MDELLSDAVKLRTAQDRAARPVYESLPSYVQETLGWVEKDATLRNSPLGIRITEALRLKELGNACFKAKEHRAALNEYIRAAGLFVFVEPRVPDWKRRGITDATVRVKETLPLGPGGIGPYSHGAPTIVEFPKQDSTTSVDHEAAARSLLASLYSNMAATYEHLGEYDSQVRACGDCLRCDPR